MALLQRRLLHYWARNTYRIGIAADLHLTNLQPSPVRVQVGGPDERQMHAQIPMHGRAIDADEHAVRHRGPGGIFRSTVETGLPGEIASNGKRKANSRYTLPREGRARDHVMVHGNGEGER